MEILFLFSMVLVLISFLLEMFLALTTTTPEKVREMTVAELYKRNAGK